jgi:hypothetical protein
LCQPHRSSPLGWVQPDRRRHHLPRLGLPLLSTSMATSALTASQVLTNDRNGFWLFIWREGESLQFMMDVDQGSSATTAQNSRPPNFRAQRVPGTATCSSRLTSISGVDSPALSTTDYLPTSRGRSWPQRPRGRASWMLFKIDHLVASGSTRSNRYLSTSGLGSGPGYDGAITSPPRWCGVECRAGGYLCLK